jgi:hypothetical protein
MLKIKRVLYAIFAVALMSSPFVVSAVVPNDNPIASGFDMDQTTRAADTLTNMPLFVLIARAMNWMLGILGVLAVVFFVVSGIFYITANGEQEQIDKAKSIMMYAIIGLVIALVGLILVNAAAGLTGATGVQTY